MNTWISRAGIGLILSFGLAGCETLPMPKLSFAQSLTGKAQHDGRVYRSAEMLNGRFILVPPEDYCIDGDSLTQTFALMANCSVLIDAEPSTADEPDILTASFATKQDGSQASVDALTAAVAPLAAQNGYQDSAVAYVEVTDPEIREGLDPVHWRGVLKHEGTIVGFATYAHRGLNASPQLIEETARNLIENNAGRSGSRSTGDGLKSNLMSFVGLFQ